jgi:hypothetical protein
MVRHASAMSILGDKAGVVECLALPGDAQLWQKRLVAIIHMKLQAGYFFTLCVNHVRAGTMVPLPTKSTQKVSFKKKVVSRAAAVAVRYNADVSASMIGGPNLQNFGVIIAGDFNLTRREVSEAANASLPPPSGGGDSDSVQFCGGVLFPNKPGSACFVSVAGGAHSSLSLPLNWFGPAPLSSTWFNLSA